LEKLAKKEVFFKKFYGIFSRFLAEFEIGFLLRNCVVIFGLKNKNHTHPIYTTREGVKYSST